MRNEGVFRRNGALLENIIDPSINRHCGPRAAISNREGLRIKSAMTSWEKAVSGQI